MYIITLPLVLRKKWRKRQMKALDIIESTISCISKLGNNLILKGNNPMTGRYRAMGIDEF
jgi:hypothetical protein